MLPGKYAGEEPHCSSRITCVEGPTRCLQPFNPCAGNQNLRIAIAAGSIYADTQSLQAIQRALAIRGGGVMSDFASAACQRRQNGIAVRDGFISWGFNDSGDRASRFDGFFRHDAILTCGLNSLPGGAGRKGSMASKWVPATRSARYASK